MSDAKPGAQPPGCPVCRGSDTSVVEVPYPFIRQTDFTTVMPSACVGRCGFCQTIFQVVDEAGVVRIEAEFTEESYAESPLTSQTVFVEQFGGPVTRSFLQARLIGGLASGGRPSVLDVGCFDGALLVELDRLFPAAQLHGFDRYEQSGRFLPSRPNFRFWSRQLADVPGPYDVVSISHALMYERDTGRLIKQVQSLLNPGGVLFLQAPDIAASPWYLLMADQYYYYSPSVLAMTLRHFGFSCEPVGNDWFPREVVAAARPGAAPNPIVAADITLDACLASLDEKAARLEQVDRTASIGVLGTTGAAAFVDGLLDNVGYFVDENPSSSGIRFRDKPVTHPESLQASDVVVLPYGESAKRIKERFERRYAGCFIVV